MPANHCPFWQQPALRRLCRQRQAQAEVPELLAAHHGQHTQRVRPLHRACCTCVATLVLLLLLLLLLRRAQPHSWRLATLMQQRPEGVTHAIAASIDEQAVQLAAAEDDVRQRLGGGAAVGDVQLAQGGQRRGRRGGEEGEQGLRQEAVVAGEDEGSQVGAGAIDGARVLRQQQQQGQWWGGAGMAGNSEGHAAVRHPSVPTHTHHRATAS